MNDLLVWGGLFVTPVDKIDWIIDMVEMPTDLWTGRLKGNYAPCEWLVRNNRLSVVWWS